MLLWRAGNITGVGLERGRVGKRHWGSGGKAQLLQTELSALAWEAEK